MKLICSKCYNKLYVTIVGKVLVDYQTQIPTCRSWTYPLYRSPTYTLVKLSSSVFIYVGLLRFEISLTARLTIDAALNACVQKCVSAKGALLPSVTVEATGEATGSIAVGFMNFFACQNVCLQFVCEIFTGNSERRDCCNWKLYISGYDNKISIYAFYQIRSIKMCHKNIPYVSAKNVHF